MPAFSRQTVELQSHAGSYLRVSLDSAADVGGDDQIDLHSNVGGGGARLFSVSLDDLEKFAALLSEFVQHHRDQQPSPDCPECPNAEPGMGCAACGKPVVSS